MTLEEFIQHLKANEAKDDYRLELGKDLKFEDRTLNHLVIPIKKDFISIDHYNKRIILD